MRAPRPAFCSPIKRPYSYGVHTPFLFDGWFRRSVASNDCNLCRLVLAYNLIWELPNKGTRRPVSNVSPRLRISTPFVPLWTRVWPVATLPARSFSCSSKMAAFCDTNAPFFLCSSCAACQLQFWDPNYSLFAPEVIPACGVSQSSV